MSVPTDSSGIRHTSSEVPKLPPPRLLLPLGIGTALSLTGDSTLYLVLPKPEIAAQAGVTLAMVGLLLGANRVARFLFNPAAGALYDRFPRRLLLIGSLLLGCVAIATFAAGRGFTPLLAGRLLWGAAWSGLWIGGNTMVLDVSTRATRGRLSGRFQMWFFLGIGATSLLGGFLVDTLGYRRGLWAAVGVMLVSALMWLAFLPETRPTSSASELVPESFPGTSFPWRAALYAAVPVFAVRFIFAGVIASTTILWLLELLGEAAPAGMNFLPLATTAGVIVALRTLVSMVGAPLAGFFSDRSGRRWAVVLLLLFLGTAGLGLMGSTALGFALLGVLLASLSTGGVQALVSAIAGDLVPHKRRGRVLGLIYTLGDVGSALGPPVALTAASQISMAALYRFCSLLLLAVTLFALWPSILEARR